ncbi:MAG: alpha/beta hydrolase [Nitrospiria bacterium]
MHITYRPPHGSPTRLQWEDISPDTKTVACVLLLHGRGVNRKDLIPVAELIDLSGIHWVFPDAPFSFVQMPGGKMWFESAPDSKEGIALSRHLLTALIRELMLKDHLPADKIAIVGFSQGAVMTLDVGLHFSEPLGGLIALSGFLFSSDQRTSASYKTPILLAHGTEDEVVFVDGSRESAAFLEKEGYAVQLREYPIGHTIITEEISLIRNFLRQHLGLFH